MTDQAPAYPAAQCPTCHRWHSQALEEGMSTTLVCGCGKLLKLERGVGGSSLVVTEQAQLPRPVAPE
jgi:hypothetical protein